MADDKKKTVEKAHAASGRPVSPTEDPTDHSVSASTLAAQVDPKGAGGATVNAKSMDSLSKTAKAAEDKEKLEDDQSLVGKMRRSELFWVNDHTTGGGPYVGISPQNDPKASEASKRLSAVHPLDGVAPQTGMRVIPKDGDAFTVGEGFGPDATPKDWARVTRPDGSSLLA
jgi:hypothetical protein